jgi:hypothetical protein
MVAIEMAKQLLPLPELMAKLGLGEHAKKSAKCPLHDDRQNSFSVYTNGDGEWRWKCFAGCGGGDEPDLIAKLENLTNAAACSRYIELAGARSDSDGASLAKGGESVGENAAPKILPGIPPAIADQWTEGVNYFFTHPLRVKQLAEFRGWPLEFTMYVIEREYISMPLYNGQRGVAFQVIAPEFQSGLVKTKPIGYHIRRKPKDGDRPAWFYVPNEKQHGQRTPALPLLIGDFDSAKLLVIIEGEWDAITFALAAGWLGEGCRWPRGVGLIGVRGASGVNTFLQFYRPFWPRAVNCLVLADSDAAGRSWYDGEDCFAVKLTELCRRVAVVQCTLAKDFNQLYRTQKVDCSDIRKLLDSHGMSLESEVLA